MWLLHISLQLDLHIRDYTTEMICHREVFFKSSCPSFQEIVQRVIQRTGVEVIYDEQDWSFTNPEDSRDGFDIYYEDTNQITLTNWGPQTYLLGATLHTLLELGGRYDSKIAGWTAKRWEEVAEKVKSLPQGDYPDWLFD